MPLTLDATAGGDAANSYLTATAAQSILDGVPNTSAWDTAASGAREQALVYATTLLDALACKGVKATATQALNWPRGGVLDPDYGNGSDAFTGYIQGSGGQFGYYLSMTAIPRRVQQACAMLALEILRAGTSDVWGTDDTANVKSEKVGPLATEYIDVTLRRFGLRAYPNVWRSMYPLTLASAPAHVERA